MYDRMCATKAGHDQGDFQTLYKAFGFVWREGRDRVYYHEDHASIPPAMVARHKELSKAYAADAIDRINRLIELEGLTRENTR